MKQSSNFLIEKHPRPAYLQELFKNKRLIETDMRNTPNPNKSNWRNVPKASLYDMKVELEKGFSKFKNSIVFTFCTKNIEFNSPDIIPIKNSVFWDLVRDGDDILISDRITHHYTTVQLVDTINDLVYLSDPWPNDIFLLPGLNDLGIEAKIKNNLVVIAKQEFLRVVIGLLTVDSPSFIEYYFRIHPEDNMNYKILSSFGELLLRDGFNDYVFISIQYLESAVKYFYSDNPEENILKYAASYAFACQLATYISSQPTSNEDTTKYASSFKNICDKFGVEELFNFYDESDFYRLGIMEANLNNLDKAANYFYRSVNVKDSFFKSHIYFALAMFKLGYFQDAVNSATKSLHYIFEQIDENKIINGKNYGAFEKEKIFGRQEALIEDLIKSLKIRGDSYKSLGDVGKSQDDYNQIRNIKNPNG